MFLWLCVSRRDPQPGSVVTGHPAPVVPIRVHGPVEIAAHSILNPVSLLVLSLQLELAWLEETALAVTPLGTLGGIVSGEVGITAQSTELRADVLPAWS
jgi:hypothetical protein